MSNCCSPDCTNPATYVITELPEEMDSHNEGAHIGDLMCGLHAEHATFYDYGIRLIDAVITCPNCGAEIHNRFGEVAELEAHVC